MNKIIWTLVSAIALGSVGLWIATGPVATTQDGQLIPRFAFQDDATQKCGYLATNGKIAIAAKYRHAIDFSDGLGRVWIGDRMSLLDERGEVQFTLPAAADSTFFGSEGYLWFRSNEKWGFCDRRGNIIVQPTYDDAFPFREGLARVNLGGRMQFPGFIEGGKWGYVDTTGKVALELKYQWVGDFCDGVAQVSNDRRTYFIDKSGNRLFDARGADDFREGLCPVHIDRSRQQQDWLTRYVDRKGVTQFEVEGYAAEFHEGLAVITRKGKRAPFPLILLPQNGWSGTSIDKANSSSRRSSAGQNPSARDSPLSAGARRKAATTSGATSTRAADLKFGRGSMKRTRSTTESPKSTLAARSR